MALAQPNYEVATERPSKSEVVIVVSRMLELQREILRVLGCALLTIVIVVFCIPAEYQSTVRLMPPERQQLGGLAAMLASAGEEKGGTAVGSLVADSIGLKSSGALYVGILKSVTVQNALVDQFNLCKVYRKRYREDARQRLSEFTDVAEDRKSGLISVTVTDHSPKRAQEMASAYVSKLNQLTAELDSSAARRERLFIEDRLKTAKLDLDTADRELSEYSSKNLTLDVKEQGKAMLEGIAALEGELIATESQLSGLEQIYTPNNVRVRALQGRIDELKHKLSQLRGNRAGSKDTARDAEDIGISISKLPILGVPYFNMLRQAKIQEAVFETLTKQYELSKIEEAKELPSIKVLDNPELPERSSGPHRVRIILLSMFLTFCLIVVWIWFVHRWKQIGPEDPRKATIVDLGTVFSNAAQPTLLRLRAVLGGLWRTRS